MSLNSFSKQCEQILSLDISHRVNALGGYGPNGEVIYENHPTGCPSVLVDNRKNVKASFMSNGSLDWVVTTEDGKAIHILRAHFDPFEKREIGVPSHNIWMTLSVADNHPSAAVSLINPLACPTLSPEWIKLIKLGDPDRSYWYCTGFAPTPRQCVETAVRVGLDTCEAGPVITRRVFIRNSGNEPLSGSLWPFFNLSGTQFFVYNKEIWYDMGMPISETDAVVAARVPYSDLVQIKRVSTLSSRHITHRDATCDYMDFVGNTAASTLQPQALAENALLNNGSGQKMNRFSTPTIHAAQYDLDLAPGESATLEQSLLYITDRKRMYQFRTDMQAEYPDYAHMSKSFRKASQQLCAQSPDASEIFSSDIATGADTAHPSFEYRLPAQPAVQEYANSVWIGVEELYENCRAHGAQLGEGIELGTRDRGQDMWPKMKQDPGRIRADLIHLMSFMYVHSTEDLDSKTELSLPEKLHGQFPRQYPSRWTERDREVPNDNRPYADSALWPIDSLLRYIRETGDMEILTEVVSTVRLVNPEHPITSTMIGHSTELMIIEVVLEVLASFERLARTSPYGMVQTLYGDWCDPIDMFGTQPVGDPDSRGRGRGVNTRLTAHCFHNTVNVADLLSTRSAAELLQDRIHLPERIQRLQTFADFLRTSTIKNAWEECEQGTGFIDYIHEFKTDGSLPNTSKGEIGYTLGSITGKDFDGHNRRLLTAQAYGLNMLQTERNYLTPIKGREEKIQSLLNAAEALFYDEKLGLSLFSTPLSNNDETLLYAGRMGIIPSGTAENGEYHHGQAMMHLFRLMVPNQADAVWQQFIPIMSAVRDETLNGPFETPSTSYASDPDDPHFGAGMYFGLSGSTDWIVEILEIIAGLELNLHDSDQPDIRIRPCLPTAIKNHLEYRRLIHVSQGSGQYRVIPFTLKINGKEDKPLSAVMINNSPADKADVVSLQGMDHVLIEIN